MTGERGAANRGFVACGGDDDRPALRGQVEREVEFAIAPRRGLLEREAQVDNMRSLLNRSDDRNGKHLWSRRRHSLSVGHSFLKDRVDQERARRADGGAGEPRSADRIPATNGPCPQAMLSGRVQVARFALTTFRILSLGRAGIPDATGPSTRISGRPSVRSMRAARRTSSRYIFGLAMSPKALPLADLGLDDRRYDAKSSLSSALRGRECASRSSRRLRGACGPGWNPVA